MGVFSACDSSPDLSIDVAVSVSPSNPKDILSPFAAEVHPGSFPNIPLKIGDVIAAHELFRSWRRPKEMDPEVPSESFKLLG